MAAVAVVIGLSLGLHGWVAPAAAADLADLAEVGRVAPVAEFGSAALYVTQSPAPFQRLDLPRVVPLTKTVSNLSPTWTNEMAAVRFLMTLPFEPASIGPRRRTPYESDSALGLIYVYRFDPL